jgi:hypothetical protein
MVLRYSDKATVNYGQQPNSESWRDRFPSGARPIASAPMTGSQPLRLFKADGKSRWGLHYRGAWKEVEAVRDPFTGTTTVRMNGNLVTPVLWSSS